VVPASHLNAQLVKIAIGIKYDGLLLDIEKSHGKEYTLILKDELLPRSRNGRDQSTVSWECNLKAGQIEGKGKCSPSGTTSKRRIGKEK
jgi:hypothetical protein